jgi:nucleoside-diphosphate-sugar epimerase
MKIFITGGAGFIGINLCKKLIESDHTITIYDNFSNSSQENFLSIIKQKINLITGDILDHSKLSSSMKNHDVVIHLAAKISVSESIKNPKPTFETNVIGTQNVLNACLDNCITKIIAASTAAVYKNISSDSILDETSPTQPLSPYGESKFEMEQRITTFCSKNNIDAIILRLFNVYGIGQSPEYAGVITKFLSDIKNNNSLTIYGDGIQTRDFVSVHDIINSIILSLNSNKISGIFNIGSGTSISILDLAKLILKLSNKDLKINFEKSRTGEIKFSKTSILQAKNKLKFLSHFDISDEMKKLIYY